MLDRFLKFIKKHALISKEEKVLLAVSGGVDSMALLHLFSRSDISFGVAHCNFQLRSSESDADEQLVKTVVHELGVELFVNSFDTKAHANQNGISTQMAARELRFEWFREICESKGYSKVVLAHHLNDSIETFFLNLSRGTSLKGLRGILPQNNNLIRPLLDFTKDEIIAYANKNGLRWREDASNQEIYYKRNLIRHRVIPEFLKLNPDFEKVMRQNLEKLDARYSRSERGYQHLRESLLVQVGDRNHINKNTLNERISSSYDLYELLRDYDFNFDTCQQLYSSLENVGSVFKSSDFLIQVDREELIIDKIDQELKSVNQEVLFDQAVVRVNDSELKAYKIPKEEWVLVTSPDHGMFDLDKLTFPLIIRNRREGDKFQPLGMKGQKLVSDLLIDEKVPLLEKEKVLILESEGKVVWVIGFRIADWAKVTDSTKTVYQLIRT